MAVSKDTVAPSQTTGTPYQLDPDQTLKASKALLGHVQAEAKKLLANSSKKSLTAATADSDEEEGANGDDQPIWLNLATKQYIVDKNRLKPSKISVPHSLNIDENLRICLVTTDPQRAVKNAIADPTFPSSLSTKITRVISITKLQARYKSFESRRQLRDDHDIFLADDRIITRLPALLGKIFYKGTSKRPISISIAPKKSDEVKVQTSKKTKEEKQASVTKPAIVAAEIERALQSIPVSLRPGLNVSIRIGLSCFTVEQLAENVEAVVPRLIEKHVVKGWRNVRSINIKSPTSFAVPIWLSQDLWTDEEKVVEMPERIEDATESSEDDQKKRKRNPKTKRGPQAGQRKKAKLDDDNDDRRKQRLSGQKARAFQE